MRPAVNWFQYYLYILTLKKFKSKTELNLNRIWFKSLKKSTLHTNSFLKQWIFLLQLQQIKIEIFTILIPKTWLTVLAGRCKWWKVITHSPMAVRSFQSPFNALRTVLWGGVRWRSCLHLLYRISEKKLFMEKVR